MKPKFDSHEASFDFQTRTSTRVFTARFTRETMQGAIEACRFARFHDKMRIERETGLLFYGFKVYLHVRTTKYLATTKRSKILNNQAAEWCKTNSTSQQILKI